MRAAISSNTAAATNSHLRHLVDPQAITRAIADQSRTIASRPHERVDDKFLRATRELEKELGRSPTNEEISRRMTFRWRRSKS